MIDLFLLFDSTWLRKQHNFFLFFIVFEIASVV
eukprot:COSAG03_NODE_27_length_18901_cov_16.004680_2_plen_33_part_00